MFVENKHSLDKSDCIYSKRERYFCFRIISNYKYALSSIIEKNRLNSYRSMMVALERIYSYLFVQSIFFVRGIFYRIKNRRKRSFVSRISVRVVRPHLIRVIYTHELRFKSKSKNNIK